MWRPLGEGTKNPDAVVGAGVVARLVAGVLGECPWPKLHLWLLVEVGEELRRRRVRWPISLRARRRRYRVDGRIALHGMRGMKCGLVGECDGAQLLRKPLLNELIGDHFEGGPRSTRRSFSRVSSGRASC